MSDIDLPKLQFDQDLVLGNEIAKGGFGQIYDGNWKNQQVAVKKLIIRDGIEPQESMDIFQLDFQLPKRALKSTHVLLFSPLQGLVILQLQSMAKCTNFFQCLYSYLLFFFSKGMYLGGHDLDAL